MSKKSYKRNQNRLYREIKRRIIAEQALKFPVPVKAVHRDIETLAIRNIVPNRFIRDAIEFVKTDMANKIAKKLVVEGYMEFFCSENMYTQITDATEIEARIFVVKPAQEGSASIDGMHSRKLKKIECIEEKTEQTSKKERIE